jgi:uncharacterized Tic20 family protein/Flp pilus assembly protein TadD
MMSERTVRLEQARQASLRGEFPTAYALYDALLEAYPDDPEVLHDYGRAKYVEYVDLEQAAQLFERARAVEPKSVETLLWLGDLYALGYGRGYDAAAEMYRQALQQNDREVDAYIGLGMLHRAPTKPITLNEAIVAFRTATQTDPDRADAHLNLGMALIEAGELHAAQEELLIAQQLLATEGEHRQARGIQTMLDRLSRGEPIKSLAYSNRSSRYRWQPSAELEEGQNLGWAQESTPEDSSTEDGSTEDGSTENNGNSMVTMSAQAERTWSVVAHLSVLVGLIGLAPLGALIVWLRYKNRSPRVRFHAAQALWYQIAWIVIIIAYSIASLVLTIVFIGFLMFLLLPLIVLVPLVHGCYAAYKVSQGIDYRYPFIADRVDSGRRRTI